MMLTETELVMIKDIIGNNELAYLAEDKVFKNFRHYT